MRWAIALVLLGLSTSAAGLAHAQPTEADRLFEQGQKAFDAGDYDGACTAFQGSLDADYALGTLINLARCHKMQGKLATAWREYTKVAGEAKREGQQERVEAAEKEIAELKARLSTLTVNAPGLPDGATVQIDGVELDRGKLGQAEPVDGGILKLDVQAPGYQSWSSVVEVGAERDAKTVDVPPLESTSSGGAPVEPPPPTTEPEGSDNTLTVVGIIVGGVGVVGLVGGGVLGAMTLSDVSAAEEDDALCGADKVCTPAGREQIDSAEGKGIGATILLAGGGLLLVTGAVLVGMDMSSGSDEVAFLPLASPDGGGMLMRGTF